jgi:hypothetical protein
LSKPDELVPIYEGANVTEAHLVKNLLLDEGIEAMVSEEGEPLALPITPSHVLVFRRDEARARVVIDKYDEEQERRAARPDWICPKCGATVIGAFDECDACGADRPGSEED